MIRSKRSEGVTRAVEGPKRIQRKREKGWKNPPGTIYVGRPTKWGNPYLLSEYGTTALLNYKGWIQGLVLIGQLSLAELRGHDLSCWCKEGAPCHADILLEMANA